MAGDKSCGSGHRSPNGGVDRQSTDGRLWLGASPSLSDPRSGCLLRRHICPARSLARDSRSSDLSTLTLAKWLCGAPDWLDSPRMPGSYCGDGRAAPSPHPPVLPGVLQCGAYPPFIRAGCAHSKGHSVRRASRRSTCAWRTAPSIHTDLICDRDRIPAYAASVHELVHKHGGKYLSRSGNVKTLEGSPLDTNLIALIQFPSNQPVKSFLADPEYAPFAVARKNGSESRFQLIDDTDLAGTIPYLSKGK